MKNENNDYNPSDVGQNNGNYFGMPFTTEESDLVLVSVPWGVTASYGGGQCYGPDAIIGASVQLDIKKIRSLQYNQYKMKTGRIAEEKTGGTGPWKMQ